MNTLNKIITVIIIILALLIFAAPLQAARVKDIATVGGVRDNQLMGYGLIMGLNGTGDKKGTEFTIRSVTSMLTKMGITIDPSAVSVKNVAAVMVTAKLPPFAKKGSRIDVIVSSIGDSTSLQGGTLLFTPLKGANQLVYAIAQGPVSLGGYVGGGGGGDSVQKNHSTVGRIADGAIIEREVEVDLNSRKDLTITLRNNDFSTAVRLADIVNQNLKQGIAHPKDSGTVVVSIPQEYENKAVELIAAIENLDVRVDSPARIVLNERTGTVVMGENVRISTVAISHGSLTIQVKTQLDVSQPGPFSKGQTVVVPQKDVSVEEQDARLMVLQSGVTVDEVVRALNSVGVTPRDLIAILQAIKAGGALQADLEII
ncbi:MAG TPA: flagellar basal body P-ring protein FlgI [Nitrospirota bacterium]|nr:flagellar basal body P-ring protein FlgI [Nitrospirota bacterium]